MAAPAAPRRLEPAAVAAAPRAPPAGTPAATLATPAAAQQQQSVLGAGPTVQPHRGSGTQAGVPASQVAAQTPPNLGGPSGHRASALCSADVPTAAPVRETPETAAPAYSQLWGSAAHTSQDSSPNIDATFRPGVGAGPADAPQACRGPSAGPPSAAAAAPIATAAADTQGGARCDGGHGSAMVPGRQDGETAATAADTSKFASHLERLAAAIRQDEEIRNAQKASMGGAEMPSPGGAGAVERVSMRPREDDEQGEEWPEEGEFAADDDEEDCLATPPDARPETVFM